MNKKIIAPILAGITIALATGASIALAVDTSYTPLAPLPISGNSAPDATYADLSTYLSGMIKLIIALGAATSILIAIIGGTQYVASGIAPAAKQDAKNRITNAFIGLTLILTSYLILNSINPELVDINFNLPAIEVQVPTTTTGTASAYATGYTSCTSNAHCNTSAGYTCDLLIVAIDGTSIGSNTCLLTGGTSGCDPSVSTSGCISGAAWPDDSSVRNDLATYTNKITVKNSTNCTIIGQGNDTAHGGKSGMSSCTSLYGLSPAVITGLKSLADACKTGNGYSCDIQITGGTEYWRHGTNETDLSKVTGNTSHTPGGSAVDLQLVASDDLYTYIYMNSAKTITSGSTCSVGTEYKMSNGVRYVDETCTNCPHWHVCFW